MAETIAFSIGEYIIPKLTTIAANEIGLMYNCRDELKKLATTLSMIKDVILDAEELQEKSHFVRNRIKTLGEVLFDADDLLDEVATEDLRRALDTRGKMARQVCDFFSSSNHLAFRRKMGHAVTEIRDRLDLIAKDISKFNFISTRVIVDKQIGGNRERETDSFVFELDVIGREKEKNDIIEMLIGLGSNTDIVSPIIPIVGIGGLGKTALAQLVFNDERVVKHFEPLSWVCVSEDFNSKVIVRNILKSLSVDNLDGMEMEQLQTLLRSKLEGKRYLVVLDDVWNENREIWKQLERRLMFGASGCKIVVTTRGVQVASAMGIENPYILYGLSHDESWKLFKQLAFGKGVEKVDQKLLEIGEKLIDRCKGVPLAIKALGSTMWSKTSEREWLFIQNSEIWLSSPDDGDILSVLKLSYDQLPTHLKNCFAYCSIFPKDYRIEYEKLIQLWMAQGYIQSSSRPDRSLESIGDQYFKSLLSKSFFQEVEFDEYCNITSVKMHDLIHDLAVQVLQTNCERVRHTSCDLRKLSSAEEEGTRTLMLQPDFLYWEIDYYFKKGAIMSKLEYLRVLTLSRSKIRKVHRSIGSLKHLRYLDLSKSNFMRSLPNTISNLLNLQTLNLSDCISLRKLPRGITKLSNLRCLRTDGLRELTHMPSGIGKLTSLHKLSSVVVVGKKKNKKKKQNCGLGDLKELNDLRGELSIRYVRRIGGVDDAAAAAAEESKEANMKEKTYLQCLKLNWEWESSRANNTETEKEQQVAGLVLEGLQPHSDLKEFLMDGYCGVRFPSWMRKMGNVVKMTFENCGNCQQLQSLDQLPCLKFLFLHHLHQLEYIQEEEEEGQSPSSFFFPSLQELDLRYSPKLLGWWKRRRGKSQLSSSEFPKLTKLSIWRCPMLTSMPLHPNLEELKLEYVGENLLLERLTTITTITTTTTTAEEEENALSSRIFSASSSSSSAPAKLKSLHIANIANLKDFEAMPPECLQNLTCLESLKIINCNELASLPCLATSLQLLKIRYSPILAERCQKEIGKDWPNIAHIPNIIIDKQVIQGRKV